jgi:hypothetical protein
MSATGLDFRARLLGAAQLAKEAARGEISLDKLGASAQKAGDKAALGSKGWGVYSSRTNRSERDTRRAQGSVASLIHTLGGLGGAWLAYSGAKTALSTTESLATETIALAGATNMSTASAARWVAVARVHNLAGSGLTKTFGQLSKSVAEAEKQDAAFTAGVKRRRSSTEIALSGVGYGRGYEIRRQQVLARGRLALQASLAKGPGPQAGAFGELGITPKDLQGASKNLEPLILKLSKAFDHLRSPVERNALANRIFGRSYAQLLDLFHGGTADLETNLKWAKKYGVAIGGESPKELKKFLIAQEQAKYATLGLQTAFGTYLAPALLKVLQVWPKLVQSIQQGRGVWGSIESVITKTVTGVKGVVGWFERNKAAAGALRDALGLLAAAWGVEKVIKFYSAVKKLWLLQAIAGGVGGAWRRTGVKAAEDAAGGLASAEAKGRFGLAGKALGVALAVGLLVELNHHKHAIEEALGLRKKPLSGLDLAIKSPRAITPQMLLSMSPHERAELKKIAKVDTERHYPAATFWDEAHLRRTSAAERHATQRAMDRVERQYDHPGGVAGRIARAGRRHLAMPGGPLPTLKSLPSGLSDRPVIKVVLQSILDGKVVSSSVVDDLLGEEARK